MSTFIIFRQVALSLPTELAMAAIRATVDGAELNYHIKLVSTACWQIFPCW